MGFSPIGVGDQSLIHVTFTKDDGSAFGLGSISTSNMAMHFIDTANATLRVGTGTWTITDVTNGKADYAPSSADVAVAGAYRLYPVLTLSTGPKAFDPQILEILSLL